MTRHVVICGGGVIGSSIAYHLSKRKTENLSITVIEASEIASGASGKAGGFLALDWCDNGPLQELARKSFPLHASIAEELNGKEKYGFRNLNTLSITADTLPSSKRKKEYTGLPVDWIDKSYVSDSSMLGTKETNAQVHPYYYTNAMIDYAKKSGVEVVIATVEGLEFDSNRVSGVKISGGKTIQVDDLILAMGPWTGSASNWFPDLNIPISGSRAHSIVFQLKEEGKSFDHALFLNVKHGKERSNPEIYPRPNGEVYVCGDGDDAELSTGTASVLVDSTVTSSLKEMAMRIVPELKDAEFVKEQACFLPNPKRGVPLIGKLPNYENAFIAAGHTCWGILNSPATGLGMSELILDGKSSSVDLSAFDPSQFVQSKSKK